MNNLTQSGKLKWISDPQEIGENKKVTFVVSYETGNYQKNAAFELWNDKIDLLKSFSIGDEMDVSFNIDSRSSNRDGQTRVFTNLRAWRVTSGEEKAQKPTPPPVGEPQKQKDDLPF